MPDRRDQVVALTCAGVLAQVGMTALIVGLSFGKAPAPAPPPAAQAAAKAYSARSTTVSAAGPAAFLGMDHSRPVRLDVPRVGIKTDLMDLGLAPDGTIQVPPDASNAPAGWYDQGASPGEPGAAVILGHLDAPDAPAVFFNVGAMRPGDRIFVTRADGARAGFIVREVGSYPRDSFPTQAVYGPISMPVLRLVTCGGRYFRGAGYEQNVVVFADLDTATSTPAPMAGALSATTPTAKPVPLPATASTPEPTAPDRLVLADRPNRPATASTTAIRLARRRTVEPSKPRPLIRHVPAAPHRPRPQTPETPPPNEYVLVTDSPN
jgi:sortase family protein